MSECPKCGGSGKVSVGSITGSVRHFDKPDGNVKKIQSINLSGGVTFKSTPTTGSMPFTKMWLNATPDTLVGMSITVAEARAIREMLYCGDFNHDDAVLNVAGRIASIANKFDHAQHIKTEEER